MDQVLRNTAATASVTFYNGSTAVDTDVPPAVVITDSCGVVIVSTTATNEPGTGVYSVVIPAQSRLNLFTLTWTGTFTGTAVSIVSNVEIVGGFYFSVSELRNYDPQIAKVGRFTDDELINARNTVESEFELFCDRAFVPRFNKELGIVTDPDSQLMWVEKPDVININTLMVDGVSQIGWVTSQLIKRDKYSPKALQLSGAAINALYATQIDAQYEYGMTVVPTMIKRKALKRAKMVLLGQSSTIDERALTMSLPDIGTVNLATPGQRGSLTGVPDIDVVLNEYSLGGVAGVF